MCKHFANHCRPNVRQSRQQWPQKIAKTNPQTQKTNPRQHAASAKKFFALLHGCNKKTNKPTRARRCKPTNGHALHLKTRRALPINQPRPALPIMQTARKPGQAMAPAINQNGQQTAPD
jgi:hypothetical protein